MPIKVSKTERKASMSSYCETQQNLAEKNIKQAERALAVAYVKLSYAPDHIDNKKILSKLRKAMSVVSDVVDTIE